VIVFPEKLAHSLEIEIKKTQSVLFAQLMCREKNVIKSNDKKDSSVYKKIIAFCALQALCVLLAVGILALFFTVGAGLVLLWMPLLVGGCALISVVVWWKHYNNGFESFLVYIASASFLFAFLLSAPFVVERSLSCFVYFYAVEEGSISVNQIPNSFMEPFIQKRFNGGVSGHFLEKKGERYVPTTRAKLFYAVYYPLGQLTNTLSNYQHFKQTVNEPKMETK